MKTIYILIFLIIFSFQNLISESDSTFVPKGNFILHLIERTFYNTDGNEVNYGMILNRAYMGYEYRFHPEWSASVVIDAGRPTVFGNLRITDSSGIRHNSDYNYNEGSNNTMILKFAYVQFKPYENLTFWAGSIKQIHYCVQENYWGYRYVYETLTDKFFGIPTADIGVSGSYSPNKYIDIDAILSNGTGYKQAPDDNGRVKIGGAVSIKPVKGLIARFNYDFTHAGDSVLTGNQQLISLFAGYDDKSSIRIGAEYDIHRNHDFIMDKNLFGYSIFSSYRVSSDFEIFLRWDDITSNRLSGADIYWNYKRNGDTYIAGVSCNPVKGLSFSLSYQGWKSEISTESIINTAALCLEYKL